MSEKANKEQVNDVVSKLLQYAKTPPKKRMTELGENDEVTHKKARASVSVEIFMYKVPGTVGWLTGSLHKKGVQVTYESIEYDRSLNTYAFFSSTDFRTIGHRSCTKSSCIFLRRKMFSDYSVIHNTEQIPYVIRSSVDGMAKQSMTIDQKWIDVESKS